MLAAPLNGAILRALQDGPKQLVDLRREAGHPAQTTLRAQLKKLCDAGVIEKQRRNRFPGVLDYELSEAGRGLQPASAILERWLREATDGSLELGGSAAKAAVKALTDAWSTAMLRALAARPLTLTELDSVISSINYPSLERRLGAMRLSGLVEAYPGDGPGTPYTVTEWARRGIGPILAVIRWERHHAAAETPPPTKLDVETAFLLGTNVVSLPEDANGSCRFAVELRDSRGPTLAGVMAEFRSGRLVSRRTRLDGHPDAWVSGSLSAWFSAVVDRDLAGLEIGGDGALARSAVDALHGALFALTVS